MSPPLTDAERLRFIAWLEEDAASCEALAKRAEILMPIDHGPLLTDRLYHEASALRFVLGKLNHTSPR